MFSPKIGTNNTYEIFFPCILELSLKTLANVLYYSHFSPKNGHFNQVKFGPDFTPRFL